MAYRKTEKVLANLEARRNSILASAIDVIARAGMEGLSMGAVAARAEVAEGLIYKYFADKTELVAAVFAKLLARDLDTMRAGTDRDPLRALAAGIAAFHRVAQSPLSHACGVNPVYRKGIENEFCGLIRAAVDHLTPVDVKLAAKATLGAVYGLADAHGRAEKIASTALLYALRGIGVSDPVARKTVARMYGQVLALS